MASRNPVHHEIKNFYKKLKYHIQRRTDSRYLAYASPNLLNSTFSSGMIWNRFIYQTNSGNDSAGEMFSRNAAHAASMSKNPVYMGFRVNPYTPLVTSDVDNSGANGLAVVFAEMNAIIPVLISTTPAIHNANAIHSLPGICTAAQGAIFAANHMANANNRTNTAGGILSSRRCMALPLLG